MIVETEDLTRRYGRHDAVSHMCFAAPEGAAVALVGANGAGKTTTLKLLVNLVQPSAGCARVLGVDSRRLTHRELRHIGYASESHALPARLTVAQYFDYLRVLYPSWDRQLEADLRRRLVLPPDRRLGKLSRGMRVKTSLAAALPFRPKLLLLDEPLSGLDPLVRDDVIECLLAQAGEMTIIISSHELTEIGGLVTHVAFLEQGRLRFHEPIETLSARFRYVSVTLDDGGATPPGLPPDLPPTWLSPRRLGRTLQFVDTDFTDAAALARAAAARLPSVKSLDERPMSLVDISKALLRAEREDAGQ